MKKIFYVLSIFLLTLCSCTNENEDGVKLLKKTVATSSDGTLSTTFFTYRGNEIVSIDGDKKHTDFTYTDGLISKTVALDKINGHLETIEYSYEAGKLVRVKSLNNYIINYIHNSDGSVSYEKIKINSNNEEVKACHGILYFHNENFIKEEKILDNNSSGVLTKYSTSLDYDSKHNPLYNVLGYKKLLNFNEAISSNNSLINVMTVSTTTEDKTVSSAKFFKNYYTYNAENYPIELVSDNAVSADGNIGYLKIQYFY